MPHEATLTYTEPLLRQAVWRFWWRSVGVGYVVALALLGISCGVSLARGDYSWFTGATGTLFVLGIAIAVALYFIHYRRSLGKFRAMADPHGQLRADEAGFTFFSSLGSVTLPWSTVTELWCFDEVWLLLYSKAQFNTLPVADLPPALQSFILQRLQAAGAKIVKG